MRLLPIVLAFLSFGASASAQVTGARLQASGLTCAMCARSVFKNLETLPFVDSVDTDLEQSAFLLRFKADATVDPDQIRKRVEDAGFSVASLHLRASLSGQALKPDGHVRLSGRSYHILPHPDAMTGGEASLLVVDKSFLPAREMKRYAGLSTATCFLTGMSGGPCCDDHGIPARQRIYHLSL